MTTTDIPYTLIAPNHEPIHRAAKPWQDRFAQLFSAAAETFLDRAGRLCSDTCGRGNPDLMTAAQWVSVANRAGGATRLGDAAERTQFDDWIGRGGVSLLTWSYARREHPAAATPALKEGVEPKMPQEPAGASRTFLEWDQVRKPTGLYKRGEIAAACGFPEHVVGARTLPLTKAVQERIEAGMRRYRDALRPMQDADFVPLPLPRDLLNILAKALDRLAESSTQDRVAGPVESD